LGLVKLKGALAITLFLGFGEDVRGRRKES